MIAEFIGRIYPNGEFGVGRIKRVKLERCDRPKRRELTSSQKWNLHLLRRFGYEVALALGELPPLDSSLLSNSHKESPPPSEATRSKRGLKGITGYGRKLVRNAAYVMQKARSRRELSFLTLTLPSISAEESRLISAGWAEVVRIFTQALKRELIKNGLPGEIVGCTEIQEKRYEQSQTMGLHLHLCFVGRTRSSTWAIRPTRFRDLWRSALTSRFKWLEDRSFNSCENVKCVRKSVEGYLGKYMSKGVKALSKLNEAERAVLPSCWYVCTNSLRQRVRGLTLCSKEIGAFLIDAIEDCGAGVVLYSRPILVKFADGIEQVFGYYGRIDVSKVCNQTHLRLDAAS